MIKIIRNSILKTLIFFLDFVALIQVIAIQEHPDHGKDFSTTATFNGLGEIVIDYVSSSSSLASAGTMKTYKKYIILHFCE